LTPTPGVSTSSRKPTLEGYAEVTSHGMGDSVRPEALDDVTIAVLDIVA
jgi:hypothetical protein